MRRHSSHPCGVRGTTGRICRTCGQIATNACCRPRPAFDQRRLHEAAQRPTNRIDVSVAAEARVIEGRPPLAPERERALLEAYMPRIAAMARHYRISPNVERVEVLQEGVAGLLRALEGYDPDRGIPFWAYARWWVRQSMQRLVAELTRPSVLSDHAPRQLSRIRDAYHKI